MERRKAAWGWFAQGSMDHIGGLGRSNLVLLEAERLRQRAAGWACRRPEAAEPPLVSCALPSV